MNEALLRAREQMKGQTAKLQKGSGEFDNSPFVLGNHNAEITASEVRVKDDRPVHYVQMKLQGGDDDGRIAFLYPKRCLDNPEDLSRSATDLRKILGEAAVPGTDSDDGFTVDFPAMLEEFESIAASLIGEWIAVKCVNSKGKPKDDGTPWQNWYVQYGLGDDKPAAKAAAAKTPAATRKTANSSMKVGKKKVAKKRQTIKKKR